MGLYFSRHLKDSRRKTVILSKTVPGTAAPMLLPALFEERWEVGKSRMLGAEQEKRPGKKRLRAGQGPKLWHHPGYKNSLVH